MLFIENYMLIFMCC